MDRRSTAIRRAAAALLLVFAVLVGLSLSPAVVPTLADGQTRDGIEFRPRLDKIQEPELPPPASHQGGAPGGGASGQPAAPSSPWTPLAVVFAGIVGSSLASLLLYELRALGRLVSAPSPSTTAGMVGWIWSPATRDLTLQQRLGLTWDTVRDGVVDRLGNAFFWLRYKSKAWAVETARSAGHFLGGFAFEFVSDLLFGAGHAYFRHRGKDLDRDWSPAFQRGRIFGTYAVNLVGLLEMGGGFTGKGGGMIATWTGGGALVGVPAYAGGVGLVALGGSHSAYAFRARSEAEEAYRCSVEEELNAGRFSEKEIRDLLGPEATNEQVQTFDRFQKWIASTGARNWSKARVRALFEKYGGIKPYLLKAMDELKPADFLELVEIHPESEEHLLGAITEKRAIARMEAAGLKPLRPHSHATAPGLDAVYYDPATLQVYITEVKGSVSGMNITQPSTLVAQRIEGEWQTFLKKSIWNEYRYAAARGEPMSNEALLTLFKNVLTPHVTIITGGSANISDRALQKLVKELGNSVTGVEVIHLD